MSFGCGDEGRTVRKRIVVDGGDRADIGNPSRSPELVRGDLRQTDVLDEALLAIAIPPVLIKRAIRNFDSVGTQLITLPDVSDFCLK
jgi:hypothetical protein